jgi:hypothetical protein
MDACRAIVVPGLGHAERIAADEANDLALLRTPVNSFQRRLAARAARAML